MRGKHEKKHLDLYGISRYTAKHTHYRSWKSGKSWLFASAVIIALIAGIGEMVNLSGCSNENVLAATASSGTLVAGGIVTTPVHNIAGNFLAQPANWTLSGTGKGVGFSGTTLKLTDGTSAQTEWATLNVPFDMTKTLSFSGTDKASGGTLLNLYYDLGDAFGLVFTPTKTTGGSGSGDGISGVPNAVFAGRDFWYHAGIDLQNPGYHGLLTQQGSTQMKIWTTNSSGTMAATSTSSGNASGTNPVADAGSMPSGGESFSINWTPSSSTATTTTGTLKLTINGVLVTYPNLVMQNSMYLGLIGSGTNNFSTMTFNFLNNDLIATAPPASVTVNYQRKNPYTNSLASMTAAGSIWGPSTINANIGDGIGVVAPSSATGTWTNDSNAYDYAAPAAPSGYTFSAAGSAASITASSNSINAIYTANKLDSRLLLFNQPNLPSSGAGSNATAVYGPLYNNNGSAGVTSSAYGAYTTTITNYSDVNGISNAYATYTDQSYTAISGFPTDTALSIAGYSYTVARNTSGQSSASFSGASSYATISSAESVYARVPASGNDYWGVFYSALPQTTTAAYSYASGTPGTGTAAGSAAALPTSLALSGATGDRLSFAVTPSFANAGSSGGAGMYEAASFTVYDTTTGSKSVFTAPYGYAITSVAYAGSSYAVNTTGSTATIDSNFSSAYSSMTASNNAMQVILTAQSVPTTIYLYTETSAGAPLSSGVNLTASSMAMYYGPSGFSASSNASYAGIAMGANYSGVSGFPTDTNLSLAGYRLTTVRHTYNNLNISSMSPAGYNGTSYATMSADLAGNSGSNAYKQYWYGTNTVGVFAGNGYDYWAVVYIPIAPTLLVNNVVMAQTATESYYSAASAFNTATKNGDGTAGSAANLSISTVDGASGVNIDTRYNAFHNISYLYSDPVNGASVSATANLNIIGGGEITVAPSAAASLVNALNLNSGASAPDSGTIPAVTIMSAPSGSGLSVSDVTADNQGNMLIAKNKLNQSGDYQLSVAYTYAGKAVTVTDKIHVVNPVFALPFTGSILTPATLVILAAAATGSGLLLKKKKHEKSEES